MLLCDDEEEEDLCELLGELELELELLWLLDGELLLELEDLCDGCCELDLWEELDEDDDGDLATRICGIFSIVSASTSRWNRRMVFSISPLMPITTHESINTVITVNWLILLLVIQEIKKVVMKQLRL